MVKPMALEQGRLVKQVQTSTAQPATFEGTAEPGDLANAPIEHLLKDIIKKHGTDVFEIKLPATKKFKKETPVKKKPR